MLLRIAGLPAAAKASLVARTLGEHGGKLRETFSVLTESALRIRPREPLS